MIDHTQRQQALDPHYSYIVQAPAGSGKTEILTQRFLVLLTTVQQPEEIIALTFTRKAASEMRQRIMQALENTQSPEPNSPHSKQTWQLANQVLIHAEKLQWNIVENPNRLRIQTIDSLCASLTRQMPILSQFGAQPDVTDNPHPYYLEAVRRLLISLEEENSWNNALSRLLRHLDNNLDSAERLLIAMLSKREQWLPYVMGAKNTAELRQLFDTNLQKIIEETLTSVVNIIPKQFAQDIIELSHIAANYLDSQKISSAITACFGLQKIPHHTFDALSQWQGITELFLTKTEGTWRKKVNKTIGFPSASGFKNAEENQFYKNAKQRMENVLLQLQEFETLRINLHNIRQCPPPYYDDKQWECIEALLILLPLLVAQLTLVFREQGVVDFSEIGQQAIHALGDEDLLTDLASALDYRIQHLLIDEFQDTSVTQFRLLEKITANWEEGDGRTLFVVGDPMQSIYRFRAAEVGLFLKAQQQGIGHIKLHVLQLSSNFRSQSAIVEWINHCFKDLFPQTVDIRLGAVPYHPSEPIIPRSDHQAVMCHNAANYSSQAQQIIEIIQKTRGSVAILVRARSHLQEIASALKTAFIPYQAVEIETLYARPIIQDLWSLTRALLYVADRLAWFSVLRAPWCGLMLSDLHAIAQPLNNDETIWQRITNPETIERLSIDGKIRLEQFINVFSLALQHIQRQPLRYVIETTWLSLGGPACVENSQDLEHAAAYFDLLAKQQRGGTLVDRQLFENNLYRLFAADNQATIPRVQLMTIHKAKGLEFDTVIVPALERRAPYDASTLLLWSERPTADKSQLLLAPISEKSQEDDAIYQFMRRENNYKAQYELIRLLYVAATRAKEQLHLLCCSDRDENNKIIKPKNNSFLAVLWNKLNFSLDNDESKNDNSDSQLTIPAIHRLSINWRSPLATSKLLAEDAHQNPIPRQGFVWSMNSAAAIGTIIHRELYRLSQGPLPEFSEEKIQLLKNHWLTSLKQSTVLSCDLNAGSQVIETAIKNILSDERGRWILNCNHREAHSEYPLSAVIQGAIKQVIIDRTFIDENNSRWIIDYKTSHDLPSQDVKQYQEQLQQYATILNLQEQRETRLALYFPLQRVWIELGDTHHVTPTICE